MRKSVLLCLVALLLMPASAMTTTVVVRLHTPPAGQLTMEDLWWVELIARQDVRANVFLHGEVHERTQGLVFRANSNEFPLALRKGERRTIRLRDIKVQEPWYKKGYEAFYMRTGRIPDGDYTYIVLLEPDLGGDTGRVKVSAPRGLRLVAPRNASVVEDPSPKFSWTLPGPPERGRAFRLRIAEILPRQTKEEAIRTFRPWFDSVTTGMSFPYPRSARRFEDGHRYAWQVQAEVMGRVIAVSEVWEFRFRGRGILPPGRFTDIYFTDAGETKGSVYHRNGLGIESKVYTRPANRIYSFLFTPWDPDRLYFVNANEFKIYEKQLGPGAPAEAVVYTHTTYVRDIAIGKDGLVYFSEATGAGGDGKIYRLAKDGTKTLFYTVRLATVDGFWGGDFTFGPDGVLYLSTGNRVGASIYEVDVAADVVNEVFTAAGECIEGMTFGPDGYLYYADWRKKIYRLDLESGARTVIYDKASRNWLSDVGFKPFEPGVKPPGGVTTWVMPYGVGGTSIDRIDTAGLTDYTEGGLVMNDAPFGSHLGFRSGSSSVIPTTDLYYYRWEYKHDAEAGWHDFDEAVVVHYVKEVLGFLPTFPTFKLGPEDVGGKNLYRFKPHDPPSIPGATTYWPTSEFLGDIYSGFLNTTAKSLAPGKYWIRLSVFDSTGVQQPHGAGFSFVVPNGVGAGGTILTRNPKAAELDGGGFKFALHVDNRPCSAYVEAPTIGGTPASDTCGFLRYDPDDPAPVHIGYNASHPNDFGVFHFRIVRGINLVDSSLAAYPDVDTNQAGVYVGDGNGNFEHDFLRSTILGPCTEAALSENLYVYAKATTGWSTRISAYDASFVRAFALAEEKE